MNLKQKYSYKCKNRSRTYLSKEIKQMVHIQRRECKRNATHPFRGFVYWVRGGSLVEYTNKDEFQGMCV